MVIAGFLIVISVIEESILARKTVKKNIVTLCKRKENDPEA